MKALVTLYASVLLAAGNGSAYSVNPPVPVNASPPPAQAPAPITPPATSTPAPAPKATPATVDCTMQSGTFQLVAAGFTNATAGMAMYKYYPCDKLAYIFLPPLSGPSNATTFTASPLPAFLIPATIGSQEHLLGGFDNGKEQAPISVIIFAGDPTMRFLRDGDETGWTPSGSKGVGLQVIPIFLD